MATEDSETILSRQAELMDSEQKPNFKICAVANLEAAVSELEEEANIDSLHADLIGLRQENLELCRMNAECARIQAKPDSYSTHLSTTQANVQVPSTRSNPLHTKGKKITKVRNYMYPPL